MAETVKHFPLPALTCLALILFLAVFVAVFLNTFVFSSKEKIASRARLALDLEDQESQPRVGGEQS
jgi:cbb3-type cytochrome oxidase subunit 3